MPCNHVGIIRIAKSSKNLNWGAQTVRPGVSMQHVLCQGLRHSRRGEETPSAARGGASAVGSSLTILQKGGSDAECLPPYQSHRGLSQFAEFAEQSWPAPSPRWF